jgi:asparagine synthase (glutamine-hydrolysing)
MCGIAGIVALDPSRPVDPARLRRSCDLLRHRGPDDEGIYLNAAGTVGLGHRRLSIIDLTTGHQPMSTPDGRWWIVYNGEIYNFRELRAELVALGDTFATTSDTEVILALFARHGPVAFDRLNGIFALAIYDAGTDTVTLARDHYGVKPLYHGVHDGRLAFGSEIKAVLECAGQPREVDLRALEAFLTFRYNPAPETLVRGVLKLPAGHFLQWRPGVRPAAPEPFDRSRPERIRPRLPEAIEEYRRLVQVAVERQLVSDVPVGLLLSGGVDSAALGYCMAAASRRPVSTFSVGFEGRGDTNELDEARATARRMGADHHEITISRDDYLRFFPRSFWHAEEPIAESTIGALWYVAGLAAQEVKVALAGQGADELHAGYRRYLGASVLDSPVAVALLRGLGPALTRLPRNLALKRALSAAQADGEFDRLVRLVSIFTPAERTAIVSPDVRATWEGGAAERLETMYETARTLEPGLARLLYVDVRTTLPDDLLLFNDKMTMAHSLEMRVPFLDRDLVRFVESLPPSYKLRGGRRKFLHKLALAAWLPADVIRRKKRGFATPMDEWLRHGLAGAARELFHEEDAAVGRYFDLGVVDRLVCAHERGLEARQLQLFALLSFELWHRSFIQGREIDATAMSRQ